MKILNLFFCLTFIHVEANLKRYDGYQLYSVTPKDTEALEALLHLQKNDITIDFWKQPSQVGRAADVMVPRNSLHHLETTLHGRNLDVSLAISDVQKVFDNEREQLKQRTEFKSFHDPKSFTFNQYHKHSEINSWLDQIAASNPSIASTFSIGKSFENRDMKVIKIGKPGTGKQGFWLDAGIHAREWIAPATAIYIINQLISQYGSDASITALVNSLDFYIIPVLNPDGYDYTWNKDRNWRKTRSGPYVVSSWFSKKTCWGVDPNRNFPVGWDGAGISKNPCAFTYDGPAALSEVECKNTYNWLRANRQQNNITAYISFHSYSQLWMYPYAYQPRTYPQNKAELLSIAQQGSAALKAVHGTNYKIGSPPDILYAASGSSMDFADDEDNVSNPQSATPSIRWSYTLELRPSDGASNGFVLDPSQIIPTGEETFAGLKVLMNKMISG